MLPKTLYRSIAKSNLKRGLTKGKERLQQLPVSYPYKQRKPVMTTVITSQYDHSLKELKKIDQCTKDALQRRFIWGKSCG